MMMIYLVLCFPPISRPHKRPLISPILVFHVLTWSFLFTTDSYLLMLLILHFVLYALVEQDAVSIASMEEEPKAAALKLMDTAFSRGSMDNITCIVVRFHHDVMDVDSPASAG